MMGEEFDQWFEINHNRDLYDAWCAGAAAQRKRDVEITNKFIVHLLDVIDRLAAELDRYKQGVEVEVTVDSYDYGDTCFEKLYQEYLQQDEPKELHANGEAAQDELNAARADAWDAAWAAARAAALEAAWQKQEAELRRICEEVEG